MAEEPTLFGAPRRNVLVGLGVAALLATGAIVVLTQGDDAPVRTQRAGQDQPTESGPAVAEPDTPAFRFTTVKRSLVPTATGSIDRRARTAAKRVTAAVTRRLVELYTEGFLDAGNRQAGRYGDAFAVFARAAAGKARARAAVLTAGPEAAERYERILPVSGHLRVRILMDRTGAPTLVMSAVRFTAKAVGTETTVLRSDGRFFFDQVGGSWRIVSFEVTRDDRQPEAA